MRKTERYGYRYLGEGFKVSNNTRETHLNNNDLVVGSSGASKTGSIVYTQLKSLRDSSLIVVDTKGRLHKMFREELVQKGYKVKVIDFVNPENSCIYNPLDYIRRGGDGYKEQDIARVCSAIFPGNLDKDEPFWEMSARSMLEFFVAYTLEALPEEDHHMNTISRLFQIFQQSSGRAQFLHWIEDNKNSLAAKRYYQIKAMQTADKTFASINAFFNVGIRMFDYGEFQGIFVPDNDGDKPRDNIDIATIGKEKTVVFINTSDSDHSMDQLINIFYTQVLQTLMAEADENESGQLEVPVRIIMDDFASSAVIPDFDKLISVVRSRDIWLTLCIQSLTQLETLYSESQALTIQNNCDHIIYMGSNDLSSAQYIGTRAQKTPETILCMSRDMEYILEAGRPVSLIPKIPSYSFEEEQA